MSFDAEATAAVRRAILEGRAAMARGQRPAALGIIVTLRDQLGAGLPGEVAAEAQALVDELVSYVRRTAISERENRRERLERELVPCARCDSEELLVSTALVTLAIPQASLRQDPPTTGMKMIVCNECGDTRFVAEDPKTLAATRDLAGNRLFTTVRVRGTKRGPFR